MYYVHSTDKTVGQIHAKAKGQGAHFTWAMLPLEYTMIHDCDLFIRDEYGILINACDFERMVNGCTSQSYEERLE